MKKNAIVIASQFSGPPKSGNGGYVCGRVAAFIEGAASVRLKAPPPLETEMRVEKADGGVRLMHGDVLIAEGRPGKLDITPPAAPSFAEAQKASESYIGFRFHPFPRCFVCGTKRNVGDGLRIFPSGIASRELVAAPWVPDAGFADASGKVRPEFLWAALDCPSAFSFLPIAEGRAVLLGELTGRLDGTVKAGEQCVSVGWLLGVDGRKRYAGSAIFSSTGQLVAISRATWIEVPAASFAA